MQPVYDPMIWLIERNCSSKPLTVQDEYMCAGGCDSIGLMTMLEACCSLLSRVLCAAGLKRCSVVQALQLGRREVLGYRGHPLRRPIASNEIAWLARVLVRASDVANAALGLDRPATEEEAAQGGPVQVLPLHHPPPPPPAVPAFFFLDHPPSHCPCCCIIPGARKVHQSWHMAGRTQFPSGSLHKLVCSEKSILLTGSVPLFCSMRRRCCAEGAA